MTLPKPKKPRRRKCKTCREYFVPVMPIQPTCLNEDCQVAFAIEYAEKQRKKNQQRVAREKREREKAFKAETKRRKEAIKPRGKWLKEAQDAFNAFIRIRDYDLPCISCGRLDVGKWDAGHYRSVGAARHLRFNEDNCWGQCVPCNQHMSGNQIEYRKGLIARIGEDKVLALENDNSIVRFSIEDLAEIKARYLAKVKELEAAIKERVQA